MAGFWVHRIGDIVKSPETQMLQPMHSRIVSSRPVRIFSGRNGSAIDGRAAPMKSRIPSFTWRTIRSGEVNRPTPTTGLLVSCFSPVTYFSCSPSAPNREVAESASQVPMTKSHRSGSSPSSPRISSMSPRRRPASPRPSSTLIRQATAARPSAASRVSCRISRSSRIRLRALPPYSSVRWLYRGDRKCSMPPNECPA